MAVYDLRRTIYQATTLSTMGAKNMTTALQLITSSLRKLGAVAAGERRTQTSSRTR